MLQMGDTVGLCYTAPKISAISYLFRTFSLLIMGDTERPRYTDFRGLSVRGITALQCIDKTIDNNKNERFLCRSGKHYSLTSHDLLQFKFWRR